MTQKYAPKTTQHASTPLQFVPEAPEAEKALLAAVILDNTVMSQLRLAASDFYTPGHIAIFQSMQRLSAAHLAIDQITLAQELNRSGALELIGGPAYLAHLVYVIPTSLHWQSYAREVAAAAFQRRLLAYAQRVAEEAARGDPDLSLLYRKCSEALAALQPPVEQLLSPSGHADLMLSVLLDRRTGYEGVRLGFTELDNLLGGLFPGEMMVVGARPGIGKSEILLQMAHYLAAKGRNVLFVSREMSLRQIAERELTTDTGLSRREVRAGIPHEDRRIAGVLQYIDRISRTPLYFLNIDQRVDSTVVSTYAHQMKDTIGVDAILVDYLQLLSDMTGDGNSNARVGRISMNLKSLALELNTRVIVASQLNRAPELRNDSAPTLADLRDSGCIEQDADVVLLLHRQRRSAVLDIEIAKSRQVGAAQGSLISLIFDHTKNQYRDNDATR